MQSPQQDGPVGLTPSGRHLPLSSPIPSHCPRRPLLSSHYGHLSVTPSLVWASHTGLPTWITPMTLQVFISKLLSQISLPCLLHTHYTLSESPSSFQLLNVSSNYIIIFILLIILSRILSSIISFPVHSGLAADREGDHF